MDLKGALESIKEKLTAVPGVKTCAIGIEATLNPEDYPIVRIVPSAIRPIADRPWLRTVEVTIVFGDIIHEFDTGGVEAVYDALLDMEAAIIAALKTGENYGIRHLETLTDEDQLEGHKMMAARFALDVKVA